MSSSAPSIWRNAVTGLRRCPAILLVLCSAMVSGPSLGQSSGDYTLKPGDKIDVAVWKETELQKSVVIRPDGKFSFPLAGEINATNRSVEQVRVEIESRLKRYIPEPVVTVSLAEIGGNRIYVLGQVNKPGAILMNPQLNVLQALSIAGGGTAFAKLDDIFVLRGSGPQQRTLSFRYSQVSAGKNLEQNIFLESGDVVVVP
jgi:polysaccharide export outer membrane protein